MSKWRSLGFRCNPFGDVPEEDRGQLCVEQFDVTAAAARLRDPCHALQLLGVEGAGKSTHLYALQQSFPHCPVTYIPAAGRVKVPRAPVVFVDESQRLSWWSRFWVFRRRAALVLATHRCHAAELRRAGRTVETHRLRGLDVKSLGILVTNRFAWAAGATTTEVSVPQQLLAEIPRAHGHDVRSAIDTLYDWAQAPEQLRK